MIKAVREAKLYASWLNPNDGYEQAVSQFIGHCLALVGDTLKAFPLALLSGVAE